MPATLAQRLRKRLAAYSWRRVGVLAGVSLGLALALVGYLFGPGDRFFGRLFPAFFVFFWLLAVTFLGVVPFITWATSAWFGRGWQAQPQPAARPRRSGAGAARPASSHAATRRPETI